MPAATQLPDGTWDYGDKTYDPKTGQFSQKGGTAGGGMPNFDNVAGDPGYTKVLDEMWKRFSGDNGASQAIDLAGGKIREAGIGAGKELGANLAARGVSGSGVEGLQRGALAGKIQGGIAGAASDIANQREREKDAMLGQIGGTVGSQASANLANRQFALNQWEGVRADQRATEQQQSAMQMALLEMLAGAGQNPFDTSSMGGGIPYGASTGGLGGNGRGGSGSIYV